jgi:hypothetical protein
MIFFTHYFSNLSDKWVINFPEVIDSQVYYYRYSTEYRRRLLSIGHYVRHHYMKHVLTVLADVFRLAEHLPLVSC